MHQPVLSSSYFDPSPTTAIWLIRRSRSQFATSYPRVTAAAIRHQFQETMRATWLSAEQEKEKLESGIEQATVTLGSGSDTLADAGEESLH